MVCFNFFEVEIGIDLFGDAGFVGLIEGDCKEKDVGGDGDQVAVEY